MHVSKASLASYIACRVANLTVEPNKFERTANAEPTLRALLFGHSIYDKVPAVPPADSSRVQ